MVDPQPRRHSTPAEIRRHVRQKGERPRKGSDLIQRADDQHVQIQIEQPAAPTHGIVEQLEFQPLRNERPKALDRDALDSGGQPVWRIRHANETMRNREVPSHHVTQALDIRDRVGALSRAFDPEADDREVHGFLPQADEPPLASFNKHTSRETRASESLSLRADMM